ncbi:MAG: hypothetical protein ACKKMR_03450 [Candidatus Nealsonbacteria bacterium]
MEKIILPIKTKIAAWWMIVVGGMIGIGLPVLASLVGLELLQDIIIKSLGKGFILIMLFVIFQGILIFVSGYFLLKRKRRAWYLAIIILLITSVGSALSVKFIFVIPLILLFFDHKNFWKIAV